MVMKSQWLIPLGLVSLILGCGGEPAPSTVALPCDGLCPAEECIFGICTDRDDGCEGDEDCAEGEVCDTESGQCVDAPVACEGDEDCAEGEVCDTESGQCVDAPAGCEGDGDCAEGEVCDTESGQCVDAPAGCEGDGDCAEGEVCDTDSGQCVDAPAGCEGDEGCGDGQICEENTCVEGCRDDLGCGDGEICQDLSCVDGCRDDLGCPDESYCDVEQLSCDVGCRIGACPERERCDPAARECVPDLVCEADLDCLEGEVCEDGQCAPGCRGDESCSEGEICVALSCVAGCRDDGGCSQGEVCEEDSCREGCREDAACDESQFCDLDNLVCEEGCRLGQCPEGQACDRDSRECVVIPCDGDEECGLGQICEEGACIDGCRGDEGCADGEICSDSLCGLGCRDDEGCAQDEFCGEQSSCQEGCRVGGCPEGQECLTDVRVCVDAPCVEDAECGQGEVCSDGECRLGCRGDDDCVGDQVCNLDLLTCVDPLCDGDGDCDEGEICIEEICLVGCREGDCPEGQFCNLDIRICLDDPCEADDQCEVGDVCDEGICREGCREDGACASDSFCNVDLAQCQGGCREFGCPPGQECDLQIRICQDVGCQNDPECGLGQICEGGECLAGCRQDDACSLDQICVDLTCVSGCRQDSDCGLGEVCGDEEQCVIGCRLDTDCGIFQACNDGQCGQRTCLLDEQCDLGTFCQQEVCVPGCRTDEECGAEGICLTNTCTLGCRVDDDCADDSFCGVDNTCTFGCRLDDDCAQGEVCLDLIGVCSVGCRGDGGCDDDEFCRIQDVELGVGACEAGCRPGGCDGEELCDVETRQCRAPDPNDGCTLDGDCRQRDAALICEDDICVIGCREDGDCEGSLVCEAQVCRVGCRADDDCLVGDYCDGVLAECRAGCRGNADCGSGETCEETVNGRECVAIECAQDNECPAEFFCSEGEVCAFGCREGSCSEGFVCDEVFRSCVTAPCGSDDECNNNEVCSEGICFLGCRADNSCVDSDYCEIARGQDFGACEEGCRVGGCEEQSCDTESRQCRPSACVEDSNCEASEYCRDGVECVFGCRDDASCAEGQVCDDVGHFCLDGCREDDDSDDVCQQSVSSPVALDLDQTLELSGRVCIGDEDFRGVELAEGEQLRLELRVLSIFGRLSVSVLDPDCGETLLRDENGTLDFVAPRAGTYAVRVAGEENFDTSGYDLLMTRRAQECTEDPQEPNESAAAAVSVDVPVDESVALSRSICQVDQDYYAISIQAGGTLNLSLSQSLTDGPLALEIRDGQDELISSTQEVLENKTLVFGPVAQQEEVFVRVAPVGVVPVSGISYTLTAGISTPEECEEDIYEPNDAEPFARSISAGSHALNLCQVSADDEWFAFELSEGDFFNLSLTYDHGLIAPEQQVSLTLFGPGGSQDQRDVGVADGETDRLAVNTAGFVVNAQNAGTWFLSVESFANSDAVVPMTLDLVVEAPSCEEDANDPVNESCVGAARLDEGVEVDGFLCGPSRDEDFFLITPDADQQLTVVMEHFTFEGNLDLELYTEDGLTLLGFSNSGVDDIETVVLESLPAFGDVCIRVVPSSGEIANAYTLRADFTSP